MSEAKQKIYDDFKAELKKQVDGENNDAFVECLLILKKVLEQEE